MRQARKCLRARLRPLFWAISVCRCWRPEAQGPWKRCARLWSDRFLWMSTSRAMRKRGIARRYGSNNMPPPLLQASGVTKSFAGVRALRGASLELRAGEVRALIDENGVGKATLIKIMAGAVTADFGVLRVSGEVVPQNSPAIARALG